MSLYRCALLLQLSYEQSLYSSTTKLVVATRHSREDAVLGMRHTPVQGTTGSNYPARAVSM